MKVKDKSSMRRVATIEARMTSSRLPGKILKGFNRKTALGRLVERARKAKLVDEVVVATTTNPQDDAVESWARKVGISIYRGSEEDVLLRVLEAARFYKADIIVELTGDCPLLDPVLIDQVIDAYLEGDFDYVSNNKERSFARGFDVQVFSRDVLEEVNRLTDDPADHEHVSLLHL
jgi:spore coat polysaccharide biosynthesis protein SpsF